MRGKPPEDEIERVYIRITPADAGKTAPARIFLAHAIWDHPRGCGENACVHPILPVTRGSPPRMRGKQQPAKQNTEQGGITPADAGKTLYSFLSKNRSWDHPRGCGENCWLCQLRFASQGSPPRMRGKLRLRCDIGSACRITPADAGKTLITPVSSATS